MTHACHKQISGNFCWYLLSDGSSAPSCSWATKCPPCQQYKRHTHGRYSHNHSTNQQTSARIFRYHKQPTVQLFDANKERHLLWICVKSGCDFISKQQNKSGKTHDRHKHAKRLCQPSMNLQTFFLIFYFFIVLLLVF